MTREFKFKLNDFVHIVDDPVRIYRIVGYQYTSDFTYKGETIEILYELSRDMDGTKITAHEDDLIPVRFTWEHMNNLEKLQAIYSVEKTRTEWIQAQKTEYTDELLDAYNDYMNLYRTFFDDRYREIAIRIKEECQRFWINRHENKAN